MKEVTIKISVGNQVIKEVVFQDIVRAIKFMDEITKRHGLAVKCKMVTPEKDDK